jgi:hypothetical protein
MNLKKILITLSGDDYSIIYNQKSNQIKNRFMAIGGFVAAIFALCFISSYFTFTKLFHNQTIGIIIGLFFSYMITNIYLLLLYTLSKNSFPSSADKVSKYCSIFVRVIFICFIAIVVSKPIETIIFSSKLKDEIEMFKEEKRIKYTTSTTDYFNLEIDNLNSIIAKQNTLNGGNQNQLNQYITLLHKKIQQKKDLIDSMTFRINDSKYYIQSILILNTKYQSCWFITLFTILIFLFPAYLKNFLAVQSSYYETKRTIENRLVMDEYASFKARYNLLFQDNLDRNIQFSESYIDPPFNTRRKTNEREILKEDDLISDIYNA